MHRAALTTRRARTLVPASASVAVRRRPISDVGLKAAAHPASDDVLLHHSPIPTYYFQQSLPKLAIPSLDATCDKYKYFTAPLLAPDVHADLCVAVEAFRAGEGRQLHEALTAWDKVRARMRAGDATCWRAAGHGSARIVGSPLSVPPPHTTPSHTPPPRRRRTPAATSPTCGTTRTCATGTRCR
jgi:hypothetical protein